MKDTTRIFLVALAILGGVHKSFAPIPSGILQVYILPPEAVAAGAQWSVDGPLPLRDSGSYTVAAALGIVHTVYFTDISGWTTPASLQVTVTEGETNVVTGTYVALSGAPVLVVALTSTNTVVVSWPSPSTGWNLWQDSDLTTTNWVAPPETVTDDGTNKFIIISPPSGKMFFRLQQ
jgi:hypothetical protein